MIPILAETVWSIIHGPATTGHLVEVSQFLKRPIDVWTEDRLLLFCQCYNRQKPRLHLKYKSLTNKCPSCKSSSSSKAVGHFTLLQGHEPHNPDARSHPENCGFDVISDQTGYPATALRQVAAQRMLAKLYESRLRGRDHRFQCPHCSVSGGLNWNVLAQEMIDRSKNHHNGHAHLHVFHQACEQRCRCPVEYKDVKKTVTNYKVINCIQKYVEITLQKQKNREHKQLNVEVLNFKSKYITVFDTKEDLKECLTRLLSDYWIAAASCICNDIQSECNQKNIRKGTKGGTVSGYMPNWLVLGKGRIYRRKPGVAFVKTFDIQRVEAVLRCELNVDNPSAGIAVVDGKEIWLLSIYPLVLTSDLNSIEDPSTSTLRESPHENINDQSTPTPIESPHENINDQSTSTPRESPHKNIDNKFTLVLYGRRRKNNINII